MRTTEARNVLKVEKGASQDEIRRAYRREALRWHPDKNMGNTEAATRSFQHVQEAVLALRENDGESCKENLRSRRRNVDWAKFHEEWEEGKERRMEAMHAHNREQMQAACQRVRERERAAAASASGRPRAAARAAPASAEVVSTASWPKWRWLGRR